MKQCRATFNLCLHKRRWRDLTNNNKTQDTVKQLHVSQYTACKLCIVYRWAVTSC